MYGSYWKLRRSDLDSSKKTFVRYIPRAKRVNSLLTPDNSRQKLP